MVLFTIGLLVAIALALVGILALGVGGGVFLLVYSDVIVFGMIVWLIVRYILKKKRAKK